MRTWSARFVAVLGLSLTALPAVAEETSALKSAGPLAFGPESHHDYGARGDRYGDRRQAGGPGDHEWPGRHHAPGASASVRVVSRKGCAPPSVRSRRQPIGRRSSAERAWWRTAPGSQLTSMIGRGQRWVEIT